MDGDKAPLPLFQDYDARLRLYHGIVHAHEHVRDERRRKVPFYTQQRAKGVAVLKADKAFFEAMRLEKLAEREAIAQSLEDAGRHEEAAIVRNRPVPAEWRAP